MKIEYFLKTYPKINHLILHMYQPLTIELKKIKNYLN